MGKYQNTLDMEGENSASLILRNVAPNSTVLEFGPGNGYMTQYLKETLGCKVYIVEIDKDDIKKVLKYTDGHFVGPNKGDIEKYHWTSIEPCDYIIFADVLEHLYWPWKVLQESAKLLKEDGSILISVPNIGHNSVIIDLINGKFNYRDLGLLDDTHIRFFTRESLLNMVNEAGLVIEREMNTYCSIEHTEFKNSVTDVPVEVANHLLRRQDGILYQFVWQLKKG